MRVELTLYSLEGCCFIQLSYSTITALSDYPLDITNDDIQEVIEYFETTEEFEKCSELLELLEAKRDADFDMFLDNLASDNGITMY